MVATKTASLAAVNIENLLNLALSHHKNGKAKDAESIYRGVLSQKPDHADALHLLGMLMQARDAAAALVLLRKAVAADPEAPHYGDAYHALAAAYGEQGDQANVIESHRKLVALSPASAPAHSDLLHVLHYDPASTPEGLFAEALRWGNQRRDRGRAGSGGGAIGVRPGMGHAQSQGAGPDHPTAGRAGELRREERNDLGDVPAQRHQEPGPAA